jgi:Ca2+-dependent lipid-binding protein
MWLNSFLKSLWPIINPSLFIAVSDMLEDSLQATLPSMIRAVRVADLGQGTEPLRILGIRGLPLDEANGPKKSEGTHVNLEVAFAYRAQKSHESSANNAHVLLQFWTAGSVVLPVWVELSGIIATVRMRIQLNPDPPFLSKMTLTLLGQPKISLKCTPLSKGFLDVMDIPGLSKWIQGAIDSAVQAYVAPRSLQLDLKTMLSGKDAQDTNSLGVIFIRIISSTGAKSGDAHRKWTSKNKQQSDPYVTVGWQKWGKPMFSTRIIENEDAPVFEETTGLLVTPADINAEEKIQLQLWDSGGFLRCDILSVMT